MARTYASPTVTRALDAAMLLTPEGLPARLFRRQVENQLLLQCGFFLGEPSSRPAVCVKLTGWTEDGFLPSWIRPVKTP